MPFPEFDPVLIQIGPFAIRWYALAYIAGILIGWRYVVAMVRNDRLAPVRGPAATSVQIDDLILWVTLGIIVGGRLGYIFFYTPQVIWTDPLVVFQVWQGGMSFHGGLAGVLVASLWWARRHKLHFFDVVDFVAPLVPAGLGLGRLGNFINGELWGKYTEGGWGVIFPYAEADLAGLDAATLRTMHESGMLDQLARHPSQLYQLSLEGIAMFCLLWWFSRRPRPRYAVAGMFALLYGCFRFLVEFVRLPDEQIGYLAFDWLTMGQVLSMPLIVLGLILLWLSRRAPTLQPQPGAPAA